MLGRCRGMAHCRMDEGEHGDPSDDAGENVAHLYYSHTEYQPEYQDVLVDRIRRKIVNGNLTNRTLPNNIAPPYNPTDPFGALSEPELSTTEGSTPRNDMRSPHAFRIGSPFGSMCPETPGAGRNA